MYIINDIDENVIYIWKSVLDFSYKDFVDVKNYIYDKFGDIKTNKESYYNFRNSYNDNLHFTNKKEKGLFLYFLANSCINSLLRFSEMGMNQSFGNRLYFLKELDYNIIKNKLRKSQIKNVDYKEIIDNFKDCVMYLDPPYSNTDVSYKQEFKNNDQQILIDKIIKLSKHNKIFYSDLENEISNRLLENNFKNVKTKDIINISPNRKNNNVRNEVLYYNV